MSSTCLRCIFRFSNKGLVTYQARIKSDIAFDSPLISFDYEQISCIYSNIYEIKGFWNHRGKTNPFKYVLLRES